MRTGYGGTWTQREEAARETAWAALLRIVGSRRASLAPTLDAIERMYGTGARVEAERRIDAALQRAG
jgi:hypothetical protein